ncbi:MAG TPA: DUF1015 family protein [Ignavibacteriaceae bacterium]|mgnify:FL=1|jgi:uncharacterized protein (DUF1015 family)|nr:MAG: hypothetical protein BWY38_02295 [Ignavibacteria bacterium ADurb.Bin266]OQY71808.1 MAG: hypothetical protein B6D44_11790 [Ignavibacteriales bacterium UTCHB2]HQF41297.1 DUF1015 family protein [Ignavibacteriaceae bacterium]HQI41421.1 DUF1015 family protein [Ignavibacteriaceae bacterium]HQJ45017.1 DUF1015 family protein [Ignavibacteriaceae bacterium]
MAVIRPFNALRPTKEKSELVASVPYDVVNREEAAQFAKRNPLSYLHITRSEIDLPEVADVYSKEIYLKAKENLAKITKEAPLKIDDKPHFYLYRLIMNGRSQTGICATFSVDDYDKDVILKHEKTRKAKEDDRTNHIITTEAQTGVVFLTYRGVKTVNDVVDKTLKDVTPEYDFTAPDGIQHTIWVLPDEYNNVIVDEFKKINKLYIADGHHRAKSASRAKEEKMKSNPNHTGNEEYNYFIAVIFPEDQLKILPYNRVVFDLNGLSKADFMDSVAQKFSIVKTENKEPKSKNTFCMYIDKEWFELKPRNSVFASLSLETSVGEKLDVSILQNFLLNPILGIDDPRTNNRIDFIGGIRGTQELEKLVDTGKAAVAFSLYPVGLDDLMNISDAGEVMPPKSTWFEPKLRDGLLTHLI